MRRTTVFLVLMAVILLAGTWVLAGGQSSPCSLPGCLDSTFGASGLVTTPGTTGGVTDVAIQNVGSEQRIVAVGTSNGKWTLARYRPSGALDTTFGTKGLVNLTYKKGAPYLYAVAVQPWDQKLVVAGSIPYGSQTMTTFAVTRYLPNGSPDPNFGGGKPVAVPLIIYTSKSYGIAQDVAVQPDGKIVAVGQSNAQVAAVRLNPDGTLDTTFGNSQPLPDGKFIYEEAYGGDVQVALQPDGRIVIAGKMNDAINDPQDAFVMRLTSVGTLDATFSGDGVARLGAPNENWLFRAIAVDADNDILAAGYVGYWNGEASQALLARYEPDGTLDSSFGTGGVLMGHWGTGNSNNYLEDVAIQPDGRILAIGTADSLSVWRFEADGTPDVTFDLDGWVTTSLPNVSRIPHGLALQADGKFVVGATASSGSPSVSMFALLRYFQ